MSVSPEQMNAIAGMLAAAMRNAMVSSASTASSPVPVLLARISQFSISEYREIDGTTVVHMGGQLKILVNPRLPS